MMEMMIKQKNKSERKGKKNKKILLAIRKIGSLESHLGGYAQRETFFCARPHVSVHRIITCYVIVHWRKGEILSFPQVLYPNFSLYAQCPAGVTLRNI